MGTLTDVIRFALDAYGEARRKDGAPLIFHAMEAANIAATLTQDMEVMAAAMLHDAVEDTQTELSQIRARFGDRVAHLVDAETENKYRHLPPAVSWRRRKEETIARLRAAEDRDTQIVFLGDKLSNMRSFYRYKCQYGNAFWTGFNQKDPAEHHWYYRTIAQELTELKNTPAWREYDWLIRQVFEEDSLPDAPQA